MKDHGAQVHQRASGRRYALEFLAVLIAYGGLLALAGFVVDANPDAWWRYAIAPLPMIPAAYLVFASVRYYRRMDELQQRIALESLAFAFAGTALITFTYGFLDAAGLPRINWWFVWPVMGTLWALGTWLANRRWL